MTLSKWVALLVITTLSLFTSILIGAADIRAEQVLHCAIGQCESRLVEAIVWDIRFPRAMLALLVGAGLAVCGGILQNITRNPLADPYLFGIVAGAGLGATVATLLIPDAYASVLPFMAFLGTLLAIILVLVFARVLYRIELVLLAGVAVSFMLGAVTQFLLYVGEPFATNRIMFWLMGSLAQADFEKVSIISLVIFVGLIVISTLHRQIDTLMLDDDTAHSLGVNVDRIRIILLLVCAAMTAVIVSYCGGIGFVGLMIPHIVRRIVGVNTGQLVLGCIFVGANFLVWVDVAARQTIPGQEIPIGIITSILGSLFFVGIMMKTRRRG